MPQNLYQDPDGSFVYRRPTDGRRVRLGRNRERAKRAAKAANAQLTPKEYQLEAQLVLRATGLAEKPTVSDAIERFKTEYLPDRRLAEKTESEYHRMLGTVEAEMGAVPIEEISIAMVATSSVAGHRTPRTSTARAW